MGVVRGTVLRRCCGEMAAASSKALPKGTTRWSALMVGAFPVQVNEIR
jgi:hypothetical protein